MMNLQLIDLNLQRKSNKMINYKMKKKIHFVHLISHIIVTINIFDVVEISQQPFSAQFL